jgi:hypothetical protein
VQGGTSRVGAASLALHEWESEMSDSQRVHAAVTPCCLCNLFVGRGAMMMEREGVHVDVAGSIFLVMGGIVFRLQHNVPMCLHSRRWQDAEDAISSGFRPSA